MRRIGEYAAFVARVQDNIKENIHPEGRKIHEQIAIIQVKLMQGQIIYLLRYEWPVKQDGEQNLIKVTLTVPRPPR